MTKKELRPIVWKDIIADELYKNIGFFHTWSLQTDVVGVISRTKPVGIVEDIAGGVHMVALEKILFTDRNKS